MNNLNEYPLAGKVFMKHFVVELDLSVDDQYNTTAPWTRLFIESLTVL